MQRTLLTLIGLGAIASLGASEVAAQPFGPGEGRPGPAGFRGAGRFLELTEDQQAAAREIFEQHRPQREALREEMRENHSALRAALASAEPDELTVGALVIEGHALRERARAQREESTKAFASLLDPEQKRKLEALEAARSFRGLGGRRGMMGPCGGGWGPPGKGSDPDSIGPPWE